jgi:hypothetical protein
MAYYETHSTVDVGHAIDWMDHVVGRQVEEANETADAIAEGMLCRLDASKDYFDYALCQIQ